MALARYNFVVQTVNGDIVDDAEITVRQESPGYPYPVLYSDREGTTPLGNPYTEEDGASAGFFVEGGVYWIHAEKDGFERDWHYVGIGTNSEADFGTLFLPKGAYSGATVYAANDLVSHSSGGEPYAFVRNNANIGSSGLAPQFSSTVGISNTNWTVVGLISTPMLFVLPISISGVPGSGEVIEGHVFTDQVVFAAGLGSSRARARVAPVGSAVFTITKNDVSIGTVTFAPASSTGTFAMASNQTFAIGDRIDVVCPDPADAALSGVKISIRGSR